MCRVWGVAAVVLAIQDAVGVSVSLGYPAPAGTGLGLVGIVGAVVGAVFDPITITVIYTQRCQFLRYTENEVAKSVNGI